MNDSTQEGNPLLGRSGAHHLRRALAATIGLRTAVQIVTAIYVVVGQPALGDQFARDNLRAMERARLPRENQREHRKPRRQRRVLQ